MEVGIEGLLIAELSRERTRETGLFAEIIGASPDLPVALVLALCSALQPPRLRLFSIFSLAAFLVVAAVIHHPTRRRPPVGQGSTPPPATRSVA